MKSISTSPSNSLIFVMDPTMGIPPETMKTGLFRQQNHVSQSDAYVSLTDVLT